MKKSKKMKEKVKKMENGQNTENAGNAQEKGKCRNIKIFDTTLRDGEQSPGATLNYNEKIMIAKQLEKLGVDVIEAGFPIASDDDFKAVKAIAETVQNSTVAALARCVDKDIERAGEAVKNCKNPRIHVFLATSPIHMEHKLKMAPEQVIAKGAEGVKKAKQYCKDIEFSPEDASRTEPKFLYEVIQKAIEAGATTINIPDTVGYSQPKEFGELIADIKQNVPNINKATISVHCHNDLGLAVANSLEAVRNGAQQVECTINGIGERAGNAALEEIVMALKTRNNIYNATTNIKTEELYHTSKMVSDLTGLSVSASKPVVGGNAFAHEAGIHQHGILSCREAYEIMDPKMIGRETEFILGKHSGKHAVESELKKMGYSLENCQVQEVSDRIKALADKQKKIARADIIAIANDICKSLEDGEQAIKVEELRVETGTRIKPWAYVKLNVDGTIKEGSGNGVGPVDALTNAIRPLVSSKIKLKEYNLKAITGGTDALADVIIKLDHNGKKFSAEAVNEDVIMASAQALVKGANKVLLSARKNGEILVETQNHASEKTEEEAEEKKEQKMEEEK